MVARFSSLPAQVAGEIEQSIREGIWRDRLPGERVLAAELQVSRKTLRKALACLRQSGRIETRRGLGCRIAGPPPAETALRKVRREIILLSADSLENLRPYTARWIAELSARLARKGLRLEIVSGRKLYGHSPAGELQRLVESRPAAGWILTHSTEAMQRWFQKQQLPCLVGGSCFAGIDLPNVDHAHGAISRHAAGTLIRLGHRRIVLLAPRSNRMGDRESEAGFAEAIRTSASRAAGKIVRHSGEPDSVCRVLDELFREPEPPTALLVSESQMYLTVISHAARRGVRIPDDLSLICRDNDRFLDYVRPLPVRYSVQANKFADKLVRPVLALAAGEPLAQPVTRIIAECLEGESVRAICGMARSVLR